MILSTDNCWQKMGMSSCIATYVAEKVVYVMTYATYMAVAPMVPAICKVFAKFWLVFKYLHQYSRYLNSHKAGVFRKYLN
jgi:hypothetical protein